MREFLKLMRPNASAKITAVVAGFLSLSPVALNQSLKTQSEIAHARGEIGRARELLLKAAGEGSDADRAEIERRLAWLAWRFYKEDDAAGRHFDRAEALKDRLAATLVGRARFETAQERYDAARALAKRAIGAATETRDRYDAQTAFATATVEELFDRGQSGAAAEALEMMTGLVRSEPGYMRPSRLMYGLATALRDQARAGEALRSYYWGRAHAPLYPEAALAGGPNTLVAYGRFCRTARRAAEEQYRLRAIGAPASRSLEASVLAEAARTLGIKTTPELQASLSRRYETELHFPHWGLAFGHRIVDETRTAEQYGRSARIRFILLDSMVSDGYVGWLTGGGGGVGGWFGGGSPPEIYRVRREEALSAWMDLRDPQRRAALEKRIEARQAEDDGIARKTPHAFLPGLQLRIYRRGSEQVLARARGGGAAGTDVRLKFLAEYERVRESCVCAHEIRHMIDEQTGDSDTEFNARLSAAIFSDVPAACLLDIIALNIGQQDSHGQANEKITRSIVAWMAAHSDEIKGLDGSRPLLPQFDLLSDDQMRAAFRSMDPLAAKK